MKILICATQFKGGSLQVVLSLINEFRSFSNYEYIVITSRQVDCQLNKMVFDENFTFISLPLFSSGKFRGFYERKKWLSNIEKQYNPDVVLSTSGPLYWKPRKPLLMGFNLPAYVYPESPFWTNKMSLKRKILWAIKTHYHRYLFRKEATACFVQTDDVNERLRKYLGMDAVYTISNTYSNIFKDVVQYPNKLSTRVENEIRFLTICTYYPHKNLEIIPAVAHELERRGYLNVRFVLTLKNEDFESHFKHLDTSKIINLGPVKSAECPSLYRECDVMFLPTLLECFSASYAEAMIMNKPIVTSDLGFAHTVCHDAALYFDPMNPVDIVDKIEMIVRNPELRDSLIEKGKQQLNQFGTAENRARQVLDLCNKLGNH
ncbi:glycosyltransferase [Coprobacter fastidiosus]|jgi:hypothetical protein|uniref:glycosyltransferase n=1 Tax=Coprobacter fastidiosus TaxID=1099853 RepID=UPI003AB5C988